MDLKSYVRETAESAKAAAAALRGATTEQKNRALTLLAGRLRSAQAEILAENAKDVAAAKKADLGAAKVNRLVLDGKRLADVVQAVEACIALPDPVGRIDGRVKRPSGIEVGRMRVPIGVIAMIYESRPNVTVDAAILCLKAGNATILKGGSEAIHSNRILARLAGEACREAGLPEKAVQLLDSTDRAAVVELLKLDTLIDVVIPRGGEGLIRSVAENTRIPVIKHYRGNCHVYVDDEADLDMAEAIVLNAKVQRPGVCNAMEHLLVNRAVADRFVPRIVGELRSAKCEVRGDEATRRLVADVKPATEQDWSEEYLDLVIGVKVVKDVDEAIAHIGRYGSSHTESIVTRNEAKARKFLALVDSSSVIWNASTRFADGGEYGLGAEIGISTDKLHARGPMGLEELTTAKFVVFGHGEVRT